MSKVVIKIDGTQLKLFDNFGYSAQIDTIFNTLSFDSFEDLPDFGYQKIEAYKDDLLIFTGEITGKSSPYGTPPAPYNYKAESLPHILSECTLPTEAYPLQLENSTLKDIIEYICSFFDVTFIFDQSASSEASGKYELSDLGLAKKAAELINDLVTRAGLILTTDSYGQLIATKTIEQSQVTLPRYLSNGKEFDLKGFYYNYIALGQAPVGEDADIQAIARFSNIDDRRNITQIQDSGGVGTVESMAAGMRADSLKNITQSLTFPKFFCNVGDFVVINDQKLIINNINYSYSSTSEGSSISLVDAQLYER
jgi:hypothetical protein